MNWNEDMMTLTCCQDHILTENIWFIWSQTRNMVCMAENINAQLKLLTNLCILET